MGHSLAISSAAAAALLAGARLLETEMRNMGRRDAPETNSSSEKVASVPDRVSVEKESPFYDPICAKLGIVFDGKTMPNNVVEYCLSGGWIRRQLFMNNGKPKRERGRIVAVKQFGRVSVFMRGEDGKILGDSSTLRKTATGDALKPLISDETVEITHKHSAVAEVLTSENSLSEVQDSGNPIGRRVTWTSNGVKKVGEISHVVPARSVPADVGAKVKDATIPRQEESFVVFAVTIGTEPAKQGYYWPRASMLQPA